LKTRQQVQKVAKWTHRQLRDIISKPGWKVRLYSSDNVFRIHCYAQQAPQLHTLCLSELRISWCV